MNYLIAFVVVVMLYWRLIIDVVFVGKYRIGYQYGGVHYIPGAPSYYDFNEALLKCYEAFRERFPQ